MECEPDVLRLPMRPLQPSGGGDEFVVLASDGLWDVLSDEDAVHVAKRALLVRRPCVCVCGRGGGGCLQEVTRAAASGCFALLCRASLSLPRHRLPPLVAHPTPPCTAPQRHRADNGRGHGDDEAKAAAEALLEESMRRGTADNVTVLIMLLAWGGQ